MKSSWFFPGTLESLKGQNLRQWEEGKKKKTTNQPKLMQLVKQKQKKELKGADYEKD